VFLLPDKDGLHDVSSIDGTLDVDRLEAAGSYIYLCYQTLLANCAQFWMFDVHLIDLNANDELQNILKKKIGMLK
jgi:hypothetical protein